MNDLSAIRDALRPDPPRVEATARARSMLTTEIATAAARVDAPVRMLTPSPRRWWGRRAALAGGLALGGLAVLVLAVPTLTGGPETSARHGSPPGTASKAAPAAEMSARDLLLAAAARAETAPTSTGAFWRVRRVIGAGPIPVDGYNLTMRTVRETWTARQPENGNWIGERTLGYRPRTPADEEAWRKAGSPTSWTVGKGSGMTYTSKPGEPTLRQENSPAYLFRIDPGEGYGIPPVGMTLDELTALPTSPPQLRTVLLTWLKTIDQLVITDDDSALFLPLTRLLLEAPAPPALRAAAFTLLADLPGVDKVGDVKDPEGRTGTGVEVTRELKSGGQSRSLLVIDPDTLAVMYTEASASAGGKNGDGRPAKGMTTVVLAAGWTDDRPTPPAAP